MSRNYQLISLVPLPKDLKSAEEWSTWCTKVSDKMLDLTPEIQNSNIASDALYSAVMTVIYLIPAGSYNIPFEEIMTRDILNSAGKLLGITVYKALQTIHYKWITCKNLLATKFRESLKAKQIKASEWCTMANVPSSEVLPWLQFGANTTRTNEINIWLQKNSPWPFSPDLFD